MIESRRFHRLLLIVHRPYVSRDCMKKNLSGTELQESSHSSFSYRGFCKELQNCDEVCHQQSEKLDAALVATRRCNITEHVLIEGQEQR